MGRKFFIVFVLLFSYFFFAPQTLNDANAAVCKDKSPKSAPVLTSAVAGKDSVTLTWVEGWDPIAYYLVAYGRSETEIEYGSPNVGGKGTTTYTVGGLVKGVKYYFKVRPVNGCKPGKFSNKLSATPGFSGSVTNTPNLSIYKPVLGTDVSATPLTEAEVEEPVPLVVTSKEPPKCLMCLSWQLLIVEAILLTSYLYLARRFTFLKYIYSIAIPIVTYLFFWKINRECSLKELACKYFLPLDVVIFMAIVIAYKNKYMSIKTNLLEQFFKKRRISKKIEKGKKR